MWTIEANPGVDELLSVKLEGDPQESTKAGSETDRIMPR